jgi:NADH-quinone oxidoreductase E subunit
MSLQFSSENEAMFQRIVARYPVKRAALLPTLWLAQGQWGYLSLEVMEYVAERLELKPAFVGSVASFYTMFYKRPMGRHHVQVCTNLSCALVGSDRILDCLRQRLGIEVGQTTADGKFSLDEVECLASCGTAPMMQINDDYWENLTPERTLEIIDRLAGE